MLHITLQIDILIFIFKSNSTKEYLMISDYKDKEIIYERLINKVIEDEEAITEKDKLKMNVLKDWLIIRNLCGMHDYLSDMKDYTELINDKLIDMNSNFKNLSESLPDVLDDIRIAIKSLKKSKED
jgi:hypothetical protein